MTSLRRLAGRPAQVLRVLRGDGWRGLLLRVVQALTRATVGTAELLEVEGELVLAADPPVLTGITVVRDRPMLLNWVMAPPAAGSGGHTTAFRLIEHLEGRGHVNRLFLYDRYRGDVRRHAEVIRAGWPGVQAEIADAREGLAPADATVATAWPTAYVVAASPDAGRRFYLVQDFEPSFYGAGSAAVLAEHTYRLGFHGITAGPWLADLLARDYGMACDSFDFGADTRHYRLTGDGPRDAVVFYARPSAPRRAYDLGVLALERFHQAHPDVAIHLFGERVSGLPFPATVHGTLRPQQLGELYNRCAAGLALSMTNLSLIPVELLAAGCVPVVNDAPHNRALLDNPHVGWAQPSPRGLAEALSAAVAANRTGALAATLSASVEGASWSDAGTTVEHALLRELGANAPFPVAP